MDSTSPTRPSPVLNVSVLLVVLRLVYIVLCRKFLLTTLNPTLRQISKPDVLPLTTSPRPTRPPNIETHSEAETDDDTVLSNLTPASPLPADYHQTDSSTPPTKSLPPNRFIKLADLTERLEGVQRDVVRGTELVLDHGRPSQGTGGTRRDTRTLSRFARVLFCLCFAESFNLLCLVVCQAVDILDGRSRQLNFTFSLLLLLALILLVVPLVQCLLLTYRSVDSATTSRLTLTSRLLVACIPFALYCFLFSCIPPYVTSTTPQGPSESTSNQDWDGDGWLASGLGRVIVLGVVILGGLSGFGAMRTTWNFLEHIRHGKSKSVHEDDMFRVQQSLYRARRELAEKRTALHSIHPMERSTTWVSRLFTNHENSQLHSEIVGLEAMEQQMTNSLRMMKKRKRRQDYGRTMIGKLYHVSGYLFAIYCGARLIMCMPPIFVPQLSTSHVRGDVTRKGNSNGDWISYLLALGLSHLSLVAIDIDVTVWSRGISLLLTGLLILSSLSQILRSVSRVVKLTNKTAGASFLFLSLAQLFSMYIISLLVQLRAALSAPPDQVDGSLLSSLPDFHIFGRLFDIVFLIAATSTCIYRYVVLKVSEPDDLSHRNEDF